MYVVIPHIYMSIQDYPDNLEGKLENLKQDNNLADPTYVKSLENNWYFSLWKYITDHGELVED